MYSFLNRIKDKRGQSSYYSVHNIAKHCNIGVNTARRALHWLEEWGYIEIKKPFLGNEQYVTCDDAVLWYLRVSALYYARRMAAKQSLWAKPKPLSILQGGRKI